LYLLNDLQSISSLFTPPPSQPLLRLNTPWHLLVQPPNGLPNNILNPLIHTNRKTQPRKLHPPLRLLNLILLLNRPLRTRRGHRSVALPVILPERNARLEKLSVQLKHVDEFLRQTGLIFVGSVGGGGGG